MRSLPFHFSVELRCGLQAGGMDNIISIYQAQPTSAEMTSVQTLPANDEEGHDGMINGMHFVSEVELLSAGGDGLIKMWDLVKGTNTSTWYGHDGDAFSPAYSGQPSKTCILSYLSIYILVPTLI